MTGNQFVTGNDTERQTKLMSKCMTTRDLKAEMNLRTPRLTSDGIGAYDFKIVAGNGL